MDTAVPGADTDVVLVVLRDLLEHYPTAADPDPAAVLSDPAQQARLHRFTGLTDLGARLVVDEFAPDLSGDPVTAGCTVSVDNAEMPVRLVHVLDTGRTVVGAILTQADVTARTWFLAGVPVTAGRHRADRHPVSALFGVNDHDRDDAGFAAAGEPERGMRLLGVFDSEIAAITAVCAERHDRPGPLGRS